MLLINTPFRLIEKYFFQKTTAHRRLDDNVEANVKKERLQKMIALCKIHAEKLNRQQIGSQQLVLIERVRCPSAWKDPQ